MIPVLALVLAARAAAPVLSPAGGSFSSAQSVTARSKTPGAPVYCTTDGSRPRRSATLRYTGPISVPSGTVTVACIAAPPAGEPSLIASATYVVTLGGGAGLGGTWVYANGTTGCVNSPTQSCEYQACKNDPLPSTVYYFCDCQSGASAGCVAGNDVNAGTSASSPKQTMSAALTRINSLAAGQAVALCRGGKWPNQGQLQITNRNGTTPSPIVVRDYAASWGAGSEPRPNVVANWQFWSGVQNVLMENIRTTESGTWNGSSNIKLCSMELNGGVNGSNLAGGTACASQPCDSGWTWEGNRFLNGQFGILASGNNMTIKNSYFYNLGDGSALDHAIYLGGDHNYNYASAGAQMNYLIQGNEFHNQPGTAGAIMVVHGVHDGFQVLDNAFLDDYGKPGDGGWNIAFDPGYGGQGLGEVTKNLLVARNIIAGGSNAPLHITSCQNCTVENNLIVTDQAATAMSLQDVQYCTQPTDCLPSTNFTVRNNTVYAMTAGSNALSWGYQGTIVLENNAFQSASTCYNKASGTGTVTSSDYNLYGTTCSDTPAGAHSSKQSPQWVNATGSPTTWNFKPATGSPLIGAGDSAQKPALDLTGATRPSPPAIGAYEP